MGLFFGWSRLDRHLRGWLVSLSEREPGQARSTSNRPFPVGLFNGIIHPLNTWVWDGIVFLYGQKRACEYYRSIGLTPPEGQASKAQRVGERLELVAWQLIRLMDMLDVTRNQPYVNRLFLSHFDLMNEISAEIAFEQERGNINAIADLLEDRPVVIFMANNLERKLWHQAALMAHSRVREQLAGLEEGDTDALLELSHEADGLWKLQERLSDQEEANDTFHV